MTCDLVIVGGGVMGLWAAKFALDAGMSVALVDRGAVGGGGSNGQMGALAPHLPNASNEKKRFQLLALHELPQLAGEVAAAGGAQMGYRRCGRVMPIRLPGFMKRVERCVAEVGGNWDIGGGDGGGYRFEISDAAAYDGWLAPEAAPLGVACDNLTARAAPRRVTKALKAAIVNRGARIIEGFEFGHFDEASFNEGAGNGGTGNGGGGRVFNRDKSRSIRAGKLLLAAGHDAYELLRQLTGGRFGHGVKGYSALFRLPGHERRPVLYDNGVYVIPHQDGTIAVGAASQNDWRAPHRVEAADCAAFIEQAKALCPPLRQAELLGYWAGVRPRSYAKEPMLGRIIEGREIHVLTGGFKISFGIAHRLARALIERLVAADSPTPIPASYEIAYHIAEARADNRL